MILDTFLDLIIWGLAAFAVSNALVHESGFRNVLGRFRDWANKYTDVLTCIRCTSFWVIFGILWISQQHVEGWSLNGINMLLAVWGIAMITDRVVNS